MERLVQMFVAVLCTSCLSAAFAEESWEFPDPNEYASQLQGLCKPEASSALFVAMLRDKGMTKDQVRERLPAGMPARLRLTHVVQENLDDLFKYPKVHSLTYYIYRGRSCTREKAEGKPAISFSSIAIEAMKCQETIGIQQREKLAECVRLLTQ
jgi:hypothetical protein